eukprot:scaffold21446_cov52-Phaeocystis_antarctica.AAC.3
MSTTHGRRMPCVRSSSTTCVRPASTRVPWYAGHHCRSGASRRRRPRPPSSRDPWAWRRGRVTAPPARRPPPSAPCAHPPGS